MSDTGIGIGSGSGESNPAMLAEQYALREKVRDLYVATVDVLAKGGKPIEVIDDTGRKRNVLAMSNGVSLPGQANTMGETYFGRLAIEYPDDFRRRVKRGLGPSTAPFLLVNKSFFSSITIEEGMDPIPTLDMGYTGFKRDEKTGSIVLSNGFDNFQNEPEAVSVVSRALDVAREEVKDAEVQESARKRRRNKRIGRAVKSGIVATTLLGGAAGGWYISNEGDRDRARRVAEFDDEEHVLLDGTFMWPGDEGRVITALPGSMRSLDPQLNAEEVPELMAERGGTGDLTYGPNARGGRSFEDAASIDSPRQIVIPEGRNDSTEVDNDKSCKDVFVDVETGDSVLVALPPQELYRQQEVVASLQGKLLRICWNGQQESDQDHMVVYMQKAGTGSLSVGSR